MDEQSIDLEDIHIPMETAEKLDYLIRGVKEGKFDKAVKKVQFGNKLKGQFAEPQYVQNLLKRIDHLEEEKHDMKEQIRSLVAAEVSHRVDIDSLKADMATTAKAIQYLINPDPLDQSYELSQIAELLTKHGARKY